MIRRPATIISLGDYEVQCLLQQIFLRTLPADLNQLCLDDLNHSYGGDTLTGSSDGRSASSDAGSGFDFDSMLDSVPSSCVGNSPRIQTRTASLASTAQPAAAMTASLHQAIDSNEASATTSPRVSTILPRHRASPRYEQHLSNPVSPVTGQLLAKRSLSPRARRRKENCPQSSTEPKTKTNDAHRLSIPPTYPPSHDVFPELTFSTIPLRTLPFASTDSDEAVLTSAKDSFTTAMDSNWEFGTVQPDSIFEDSFTDPPRV